MTETDPVEAVADTPGIESAVSMMPTAVVAIALVSDGPREVTTAPREVVPTYPVSVCVFPAVIVPAEVVVGKDVNPMTIDTPIEPVAAVAIIGGSWLRIDSNATRIPIALVAD